MAHSYRSLSSNAFRVFWTCVVLAIVLGLGEQMLIRARQEFGMPNLILIQRTVGLIAAAAIVVAPVSVVVGIIAKIWE